MIFRRSERYRDSYRKLPLEIQAKVKKAFTLFQDNQRHPSLRVKRMQGRLDIWEGRIDQDYRFTFHYEVDEHGETICVFRNVGPHAILDRAP